MSNHKGSFSHLNAPRPSVVSISPLKDNDLQTWVVVIRIPEGLLRSALSQHGSETFGRLRDALMGMFNTRWLIPATRKPESRERA
jgi:hypothetical protein